MRVVLDTNVLISAIFFSGTPAAILEEWSEGRFEILASSSILTEYWRVVSRIVRRYPSVDAYPVLEAVIRRCHLIEPVSIPSDACDDPDDLKFLACAVAGRAACIISGDRALLRASGFEGIEVLTPGVFMLRLP
jgi:putative PIN family toxin of toxin-antitoxin system